jgi:hypothetical protein
LLLTRAVSAGQRKQALDPSNRAVNEYLAVLDDEVFGGATPVERKPPTSTQGDLDAWSLEELQAAAMAGVAWAAA